MAQGKFIVARLPFRSSFGKTIISFLLPSWYTDHKRNRKIMSMDHSAPVGTGDPNFHIRTMNSSSGNRPQEFQYKKRTEGHIWSLRIRPVARSSHDQLPPQCLRSIPKKTMGTSKDQSTIERTHELWFDIPLVSLK